MKTYALTLAALLSGLASPVFALAPESGMYWQPQLSGRAFYVEHQNGRVGLAIYAFDRETGAAEIYVSGGMLNVSEDHADIHTYAADLFSASHGPPLTSPGHTGGPATTQKVGQIELRFMYTGAIEFNLSLDGGGSDEGWLERFVFGHVRYAAVPNRFIAFDLRGEWVFVDHSDRSQAPLRFHFSEQTPTDPPLLYDQFDFFAVTYIDPGRDARLVCEGFFGNTGSPPVPMKRPGCELFVGEELLFSANLADIGLDRMQAYRGPLPLRKDDAPLRGEGTIIGLRVVMPPEPAEASEAN